MKELRNPVNHLAEQVKGLRHGVISPALVDTVNVGDHGSIKWIATTQKVNNGIVVTPHNPELTGQITNALKNSGFNAYTFSKTQVMISVPPPSGEEKEAVRKKIKKLGEDAKVAVRNIRKKLKKSDPDFIEEIQAETDAAINEIDWIIKRKLEESR